MTKYLLKRILHGAVSIIIVVAIVMILIYSLMNRQLIFASDTTFAQMGNNGKTMYMYRKWQEYGYLDLVTFADYLNNLQASGELDAETRDSISLGRKPEKDSELTAEYVEKFTQYYESQGFTVTRLNAVMGAKNKLASGGQQQLFAAKDKPLYTRLIGYFTHLISVDSIHYVDDSIDIGERGITFTLHDPVYGGDKFAPAIIGNGTMHKYLLYVDSKFPYIHHIFNTTLDKTSLK